MVRVILKLVLIGLGLALALRVSDHSLAIAQESGQVGLVIQFDDETVFAGCMDISGQALSGQDLLQLSGLELDLYYDASHEVAVCRVNELGCASNQCFCQFPDYWSYWHLEEREWVYSGRGASVTVAQPGTVEGWRWGNGVPPMELTFEQICSPSGEGELFAPIGGGGKEGVVIKPFPASSKAASSDFAPDSRIPALPSILSVSAGYLVFSAALVSMVAGLILILKNRRE